VHSPDLAGALLSFFIGRFLLTSPGASALQRCDFKLMKPLFPQA
jgi:hypothetical protein